MNSKAPCEAAAPDGTPVSDILEHNREMAAELARVKGVARTIQNLCDASHWTPARRWRVRDLALSIHRPQAAEARRAIAEMASDAAAPKPL